jgi:O-antigen/teichoic acid export membrane protein
MASNTFYTFLNSISVTLLSLIYFIAAGKLLLPHELGIADSIIQFAGVIITFSTLGLPTAALKLVSEYQATKKFKKLYGCIKYAFKLLLIANIPISVLIIILSPTLATYIFKNSNLTWTFVLAAFITFVLAFNSLSGSIIYGFQNVKFFFLTDFLTNLTKVLFAIILIIFFGLRFWGPLIGYFLGLLFSTFLRIKKIEIKGGEEDKSAIWDYAQPALIIAFLSSILTATPVLILSSFSSTTEAGIFSLAKAISSLPMLIPTVLYTASFPILSGLYGKKDHKSIEKFLPVVLKYSILISLPLSLLLIIFPQFIIRLIAKPTYLPGTTTLAILGIVGFVWGNANILLNALYALGKPKIQRNITALASFIYLLFSIPFSIYYASAGMAVTYLIVALLLFSLSFTLLRKFYTLRIDISLLKIFLSSIITLLLLALLMRGSNSVYMFILACLVSFIFYAFMLLLIKFFTVEDLKMLNEIKKISPKKLSFAFDFVEKILRKFL